MPTPLTQSLVANWPPTLRYHQRRLDPIEELERRDTLRSFLVKPNEIGARTDDAELLLHANGFVLQTKGDLLDDTVFDLARLALAAVQPEQTNISVLYQFLVPLPDVSYDDARKKALARLWAGMFSALGGYDFALLVDGRSPGLVWHCEFGVVSESEVPERVSRVAGHFTQYHGFADALPDDLPPVAFFADSRWVVARKFQEAVHTDIVATIQTVRREAGQLVQDIFTRLLGDREERTMAGGTTQ